MAGQVQTIHLAKGSSHQPALRENPKFSAAISPKKKMFVAHFLWGMSTFQKLVGFHAENLRAAVLWASTVGPHWFIFAFGGYIASGNHHIYIYIYPPNNHYLCTSGHITI